MTPARARSAMAAALAAAGRSLLLSPRGDVSRIRIDLTRGSTVTAARSAVAPALPAGSGAFGRRLGVAPAIGRARRGFAT